MTQRNPGAPQPQPQPAGTGGSAGAAGGPVGPQVGGATAAQWLEGARPRTLPTAIGPVLAGTAAAVSSDGLSWWKALLALVVAMAFVIGVNFANDYSDGIRGTDDDRVGPLRLTGSRLAAPRTVKRVAFICLGIGAAAGLVLALTSAWWLVLVGAACIVGAWYYTGGSSPYGYRGLGEVAVFLFFGPVAVLGTQFVQVGSVSVLGAVLAVGAGSLTTAVLVANNLRDIPTDRASGKRTLAVALGPARTRTLYCALALLVPAFATVFTALYHPWALLGFLALPLALRAYGPVRRQAEGLALIPVLRDTGLTLLVWSLGITLGVCISQYLPG